MHFGGAKICNWKICIIQLIDVDHYKNILDVPLWWSIVYGKTLDQPDSQTGTDYSTQTYLWFDYTLGVQDMQSVWNQDLYLTNMLM